jgi:hypothetical protein
MRHIEMPEKITFYQGGKWKTMTQEQYQEHVRRERDDVQTSTRELRPKRTSRLLGKRG